MRRYIQSAGYAIAGIGYAIKTERNFSLFTLGVALSFAAGVFMRFGPLEYYLLLFSGFQFLAIELLNTALERFTDAFDTHSKKQDDAQTALIKATKDVAAGAALLSFITWAATIILLFTFFQG